MNCHRAARLSSYGRDHLLSDRDRADLEGHLGLCPACRQREAGYDRLVNALCTRHDLEPTTDLLENALQQAQATAAGERPAQGRTTMRIRIAAVFVILVVAVISLIGTRPPGAFGQTILHKMEAAVGQAKTMHVISWIFTMTEEEARNHTWHDGKTPIREETWITHDAIRGSTEQMGPYLWNATGYLHYDPTERRVKYLPFAGVELSLKDSIERSFDPVAEMKSSAPPGTYLSLTNFADTVWLGRKVHKLQIASGPNKPGAGEEIPTRQEPGKTPPFGASPRLRQTFWVDCETSLPVHSEQEKEIQGRWVVLIKRDCDYNHPPAARLFDPEAVRKAAEAHGARKR